MAAFTVIGSEDLSKSISLEGFVLRQDPWNDYSFQTQYQMYYFKKDQERELIGDVKILKKGQGSADSHQLKIGKHEDLEDSFISFGQSLDYYERLVEMGPSRARKILKSLRDYVLFPELADSFQTEPGWKKSVLRFVSEDSDFIRIARAIIKSDYKHIGGVEKGFTYFPPDKDGDETFSFHFDFDAPYELFYKHPLPSRICVLVGRNGCGKSLLLSRLARLLYLSPSDRYNQAEANISVGTILPDGLGFTRIIALSYSAFDSFALPGYRWDQRFQIARDIRAGKGRYIFVGLRDVVSEINHELRNIDQSDDKAMFSNIQPEDIKPTTKLKSLQKMAAEYVNNVDTIEEKKRSKLFEHVFSEVCREPSVSSLMKQYGESPLFAKKNKAKQYKDFFLNLGTGHKIIFHALAAIVANLEERSVVLFDEPEIHLHPPLLSALFHGLRRALEDLNSVAVVATHSPVVAQETLAKNVVVIRRADGIQTNGKPKVETFAENIGIITTEVFGLNEEAVDYHRYLDALVENAIKRKESYADIKELFEYDGSPTNDLSAQGKAYVLSKLS